MTDRFDPDDGALGTPATSSESMSTLGKPLMKTLTARVLSCLLLATTVASADVSIREEKVQFRPGEMGATIKGSIKGDETVDYTLRASAGPGTC